MEVSPGSLFEYQIIQREVGYQLLQPAVLFLEILKSLRLLYPHAAILFTPTIVGLFGDTELFAGFGLGSDAVKLPWERIEMGNPGLRS